MCNVLGAIPYEPPKRGTEVEKEPMTMGCFFLREGGCFYCVGIDCGRVRFIVSL